MRRTALSLLAVAIVLLIATVGSAQTLDYCDTTAECDCDTYKQYDYCYEIDTSSLLDVSDPSAVRQALNIETTYDSTTETYHVTGYISDGQNLILPVHPNGGAWATLSDLTKYINELLGTNGLDVPEVDLCNPAASITMRFTGFYGRWDSSLDQWASVQYNEPLADLISGPGGDIVIDGSVISTVTPEEECITMTDGGLSAEQCSEYREKMYQEAEHFCGEFETPSIMDDWVETRVVDMRWNGESRRSVGSNGAVAYGDNAELIEIGNYYYEWTGAQTGQEFNDSTYGQIVAENSYLLLGEYGPTGVCGYGHVERGVRVLDGETAAGSSPNECPADYVPSNL